MNNWQLKLKAAQKVHHGGTEEFVTDLAANLIPLTSQRVLVCSASSVPPW